MLSCPRSVPLIILDERPPPDYCSTVYNLVSVRKFNWLLLSLFLLSLKVRLGYNHLEELDKRKLEHLNEINEPSTLEIKRLNIFIVFNQYGISSGRADLPEHLSCLILIFNWTRSDLRDGLQLLISSH